jgi:hypothetical protein
MRSSKSGSILSLGLRTDDTGAVEYHNKKKCDCPTQFPQPELKRSQASLSSAVNTNNMQKVEHASLWGTAGPFFRTKTLQTAVAANREFKRKCSAELAIWPQNF